MAEIDYTPSVSATMHADVSRRRYTLTAIALHWVSALTILALIGIGLAMIHADLAPIRKFQLYQWHKSLGITVLGLTLVRLAWRLFHRPPPLPPAMPPLERHGAHAAHALVYGLILALPLVGWALVSASPFNIPTVLYGVVLAAPADRLDLVEQGCRRVAPEARSCPGVPGF